MREQLEQRIAALKETLRAREKTVADAEAAVVNARMNRDRVAGGIIELEYALEQAGPINPGGGEPAEPIKDDTIKGQIPAGGKT